MSKKVTSIKEKIETLNYESYKTFNYFVGNSMSSMRIRTLHFSYKKSQKAK